jgi:hypothetical protein
MTGCIQVGLSKNLVRRGGPDEAHVDDHRGRRRAGQLQMVPGAVSLAEFAENEIMVFSVGVAGSTGGLSLGR